MPCVKKDTTTRKTSNNRRRTQPITNVYSFNLLDLDSKMYVAYGTSLKSEKQAFDRAMKMLKYMDVEMKSVRLDKYYSSSSYVTKFGDAKVYIIEAVQQLTFYTKSA